MPEIFPCFHDFRAFFDAFAEILSIFTEFVTLGIPAKLLQKVYVLDRQESEIHVAVQRFRADGFKWATISGDTVIIYGYSGTNATVTIPSSIGGKTVSGIAQNAFRGKTLLTSVYIPTNITFIGANAFTGCSNVTFSCEAASQPSGWAFTWKDSANTV